MKRFLTALVLIMAVMMVLSLASCGTTQAAKAYDKAVSEEKATETKAAEKKADSFVEVGADKFVVIDWTDRALGEDFAPVWLKNMRRGNSDTFKENWKVDANRVIKVSYAAGKTEAIAQALSRAGFAYTQAAELNQKVIGRVGQGLNDLGQLEALYVAASETKAEMAGLREEHGFFQKVRTTNAETKEVTEQYVYYTVYSMDKATWDALCKKYLMDVMGGANLETETQKKVGALFTEMKADADKKDLQKAQEETALYKEQVARLEAEKGTLKTDANLNAEESATKKATETAASLLESFLM